MVYEIQEVVEVWRKHFANISQPRTSPTFNKDHFQFVTNKVSSWANETDDDEFLQNNFTEDEIRNALKILKKGKAAGFDGLTAEHLIHAEHGIVTILTCIYNSILKHEYIPINFRRGTQIPLYKGKNSCPLDVNNYRGITLLSSMNKIFEILIWERVKGWWSDEGVISLLQGACRQGSSCLHSALILQEGIAAGLDAEKKVFVAYFDAARAFDSVWTDSLFYQLRNMGIVGKTWRLLYQSYHDFRCKVRLAGCYSDWYQMKCGIHQGGFLSLLKYTLSSTPYSARSKRLGIVTVLSIFLQAQWAMRMISQYVAFLRST